MASKKRLKKQLQKSQANRNKYKYADTQKFFNDVRSAIFRRAYKDLGIVGEDWQGKSQQAAPILEGHLRRSGQHTVKLAKAAGDFTIKLQMHFGGGIASDYALYQHETEGLNHPRGGGPHYVSGPLETNKLRYLKFLSDGSREAVATVRQKGG